MSLIRAWRSLALPGVCAVLAVAGLAGCNETAGVLEPQAAQPRLVARPGVSPAGASVAFVTVEGAPSLVVARFSEKTNAEAARREVAVADASTALYLVRGYLSASAVEGGTAFSYVWDVFDRSRRRVRRTEDAIVVKGAAADPWALASEQALTSLAAKSADDLAAILSNTPEAEAAARGAPAATAIATSAPGAPSTPLPARARAFRQN